MPTQSCGSRSFSIPGSPAKKVFSDITPGIDLFLEFFTQLLPFFEEHTRKRVDRMNKYSGELPGDWLVAVPLTVNLIVIGREKIFVPCLM